MVIEMKPLADVTREALSVLSREIGVVNTVRFINQFMSGYGDYAEERERLFGELTLDEILSDIRRRGRQSTSG